MRRAYPPWWAFGFAACVLAYLVLILCAEVAGPGSTGVVLRFHQGRAIAARVAADDPAGRAGLEAGDVVVSALGLPIHTLFDWRSAAANAAVGRPFPIEIDRQGRRRTVALEFGPHWRRWTIGNWLTFAAKVAAHLATFSLALLVGFSRPRDRLAVTAALLLAAVAVTNFTPVTPYGTHAPTFPNGAAAIWRALPWWLGAPIWVGLLPFVTGPFLVVLFFTRFPRPVLRTRRARALFWGPWSIAFPVGMVGVLRLVHGAVSEPERLPGLVPGWFTTFTGIIVVSAVATSLTLLIVSYHRLADLTERRRIRVLLVGSLVGLGGISVVSMAGFFRLPAAVDALVRSPAVLVGSNLLFLAIPASFAYAILRHQLLDVRLIVRLGVRYALARRVIVSLVPLCAAVLAIDLAAHAGQPLRDVFLSRGWVYAAMAVLALVAHGQQRRWLDALDRRFFRERYDAQQLLLRVVDEVRTAPDLARAAPRVVSRINSALHPSFVALTIREPGETMYQVLASAPRDRLQVSLAGDSKLVALVRLLGKPLDVGPGQSGWLEQQLSPEEAAQIRRDGTALIVPVPGGADRREALLVLGHKRSEEPYSREDQDLLAGVAGGLGLLLERPSVPASRDAFAECPRCGACHDGGTASCPADGAPLTAVPLPRVLGDRYRLDRRLGQGGMGAVYEASDVALGRRVAVKVIREDLVASAVAAERFRHEARAAASFSHPNVVTVHDFGIAKDTRAFLVMELLRGDTLRAVLGRQGRLEPHRAVSVMRDVCAAAGTAHARGLVHRDLKPENVFLARDDAGERVKVLDFGLAKLRMPGGEASTATASDAVVGTLRYMGPEQLRGGAVDPGWDLWAIAVMTYELLTGALPFRGESAIDYQVVVLAGRCTPVHEPWPEAPRALQAFFEQTFAPDPACRPAGTDALVTALEAALGSSEACSTWP